MSEPRTGGPSYQDVAGDPPVEGCFCALCAARRISVARFDPRSKAPLTAQPKQQPIVYRSDAVASVTPWQPATAGKTAPNKMKLRGRR